MDHATQLDHLNWQLQADDVLRFRHPRRLDHGWGESAEGARLFVIHYGELEIEFDDERDFAFAQTLVRQRQFRARDAAGWSSASDSSWERVRGYLEALVREDVLCVGSEPARSSTPPSEDRHQERQHRAHPCTWSSIDATCEQLSLELTGESFGVEHIETLIAVNDLARPALDDAGRQVGENNVDPQLRVETKTQWATCKYPGSRHAHACPMNLTALRKVNRDWSAVTATLLDLRARFVAATAPETTRLSVGQAHLFAMLALAWSGYMMVRRDAPVRNGELPSVASSIFMLADGIRMTTAHMFYAAERLAGADEIVDPIDFVKITDREQLFVTAQGVCAGPPGKIEEFVGLVLDGGVPEAPSQLEPLTGDVGRYLAYAGAATRVALVGRALVHETSRRRELLDHELATLDPLHPLVMGLRRALGSGAPLRGWSITPERQHAFERALVALFDTAGRLQPSGPTDDPPALASLWQPSVAHEAASLEQHLGRECSSWSSLPARFRALAARLLAEHLATCDRAASLFGRLQSDVNRVLGRTPFDVIVDDRLLRAFFRVHGRPPDLAAVFQAALGVTVRTAPARQ